MGKASTWTTLAVALLTASVVASPALARDRDHGHGRGDRHEYRSDHDRGERRHERRERRNHGRSYGRSHHDNGWRNSYRPYRHEDRRHQGWERRERHYRRPVVVNHYYRGGHGGPPRWARGHNYRSYGYNNVYTVPYDDYGRYRLHRPHHGQRWVRDDRGNFLLVAAATGIIASVLMNHGY